MNRGPGLRHLAALLLFSCALALAEVAVPEFRAHVTDLTGTLDAQQAGALEQKLAAFEQARGSQVAVLIVPTTRPEEIEQYSLRVAEKWKLGRRKIDDGALLLVAKDDRAMRIEVGYGLEGALPDAIAKRIVAETITPRFKQDDFYGGIDAGVSQMMQVIQGEALPAPAQRAERGGGRDPLGLLFAPFMILFVIGRGLRRLTGSFPASALVGAGTGFAAFLIIGSTLLGVGAGVVAMIIALMLYSGAAGALPFYIGGMGGGRGGGFGGGGFGGGGGGGFGGGGASGRW